MTLLSCVVPFYPYRLPGLYGCGWEDTSPLQGPGVYDSTVSLPNHHVGPKTGLWQGQEVV